MHEVAFGDSIKKHQAGRVFRRTWGAKAPYRFSRGISDARNVIDRSKSFGAKIPNYRPNIISELPAGSANHFIPYNTNPSCYIMAEGAGGIDRKADERMEFSTSKEVTVHPTFEAMSLKGKAT